MDISCLPRGRINYAHRGDVERCRMQCTCEARCTSAKERCGGHPVKACAHPCSRMEGTPKARRIAEFPPKAGREARPGGRRRVTIHGSLITSRVATPLEGSSHQWDLPLSRLKCPSLECFRACSARSAMLLAGGFCLRGFHCCVMNICAEALHTPGRMADLTASAVAVRPRSTPPPQQSPFSYESCRIAAPKLTPSQLVCASFPEVRPPT